MTPRPVALPVRSENIPAALRAERRWLAWSYSWRQHESSAGRWTKGNLHGATSNDPSTWLIFDEAFAKHRAEGTDGLGFVLGNGWAGADLDHCLEGGVLLPAARRLVDLLGGYSEVSPSGAGVKSVFRADRIGFETRFNGDEQTTTPWNGARYFAITGHGTGDPTVDRSRFLRDLLPAAVDPNEEALAALFEPGDVRGTEDIPDATSVADVPDEELLDRARSAANGAKFTRLWSGDTSGYASHSEADAALCVLLAFWTQRDAERIDRLFRQSKLYRRKWEAGSYRRAQIHFALDKTAAVYDPGQDTTSLRPPAVVVSRVRSAVVSRLHSFRGIA